jgi:hypothetical protein
VGFRDWIFMITCYKGIIFLFLVGLYIVSNKTQFSAGGQNNQTMTLNSLFSSKKLQRKLPKNDHDNISAKYTCQLANLE